MFNVKQLKINEFIQYIWQLIISTLNAALEVPSLRAWIKDFANNKVSIFESQNIEFLISDNQACLVKK